MRWHLRLRRLLVLALLCMLLGTARLPAADAGGSWMYPVQDRYEPGESVTLVGYTSGGSYGSLSDGPFFGYLFWTPDSETWAAPRAIPLPVGELEFSQESGMTRAAVTFTLPDYVPPGRYWMDYCNEGCEERLGDLIGAVFWVGVDPQWPVVRGWPADEPEIANLDDDAQLSSLGDPMTARAFRSAVASAEEEASE